ncbi:MAG: adenine deaminase [Armatimonadetes bacterium]|nr:adenine deaminase [Armatimonadota bacterium]
MKPNTISGNIVDVLNSVIFPGTISISNGKIIEIKAENKNHKNYIIPGFIDSHIHIESSMLTPAEFARIAVIHGTVAVVSDPHEIANVLGLEGIKFMIESAEQVPMKFYFGASSCVPATDFETSGAVLDSRKIEELLKMDEIKYLSEVMNFPEVINKEPDLMRKIEIAKKYGKPIDGHAPGLRGSDLKKYISAGISTDHESITKEEALEKINLGMKILIRQCTVAQNFDELIPIIKDHPDKCMLCSDDKHPDMLVKGHINQLVKKAKKIGLMKALKAACVNPVLHYGLGVGLLQQSDSADFLVVDNLNDLNILKTFISGEVVAENGKSFIPRKKTKILNKFNVKKKKPEDFALPNRKGKINVIEAVNNQLITKRLILEPKVEKGNLVSDVKRDILKIAVVNRYYDAKVALGFVRNFGLKTGAIASSVAHDSHNIIAVGTSDKDICRAVNLIIENKGGICAVSYQKEKILSLPIAGIISDWDYLTVAQKYSEIDAMAKALGSNLDTPLMTLSFLALLVIPELKLSDKGLFDGTKFEFVDVFK